MVNTQTPHYEAIEAQSISSLNTAVAAAVTAAQAVTGYFQNSVAISNGISSYNDGTNQLYATSITYVVIS